VEKTLTRDDQRVIIAENGGRQENVLNILLALQGAGSGYIDEATSALVADELDMSETKVYEIATFYSMLQTKPTARFRLEICNSTPCHFCKADEVAEWLGDELGVGLGETTADGMFCYGFTSCVGACEIGPVIKVGDAVYGDLTQAKVRELLAQLRG